MRVKDFCNCDHANTLHDTLCRVEFLLTTDRKDQALKVLQETLDKHEEISNTYFKTVA